MPQRYTDIQWVVQRNLTHAKDLENLELACKQKGIPFLMIDIIPFAGELPYFDTSRRSIFYGSTTFCALVDARPELKSGLFFDNTRFSIANYIGQWGKHMLNADAEITSFRELMSRNEAVDKLFFIRPDDDNKAFAGETKSFGELRKWYDQLSMWDNTSLSPESRIVVSVPYDIRYEWRLWIVMLSADARNSGVAEAGTGLGVDANSLYINPAKITFGEMMSISASYTPWMKQLSKDSHLGYLSAFRQLNDREAIGLSVKYLDLGSIAFRDESGTLIEQYKASEFSIDASYARKFGETFGMALTARYFRSDIGRGTYNNLELTPTDAFAADISVYSNRELQNGQYSRTFSWGINLSNIGTKLKYSDNQTTFLPMNLRLGAGYNFYAAPESRLTLLLDVNKLMVPTPPRYKKDINGNFTNEIEKGKDPNRSVTSALFTSLFDAPGGFKEELSEFTIAGGLEFSYYNRFFIRTGYFYEDPEKGNRQHFATGIGLNVHPIRIDVSYVFPTEDRYVLRNSMRFTLSFTPGIDKVSRN